MWIKVTGLLLCLLLWSCSAETPTSELQANPPTPPRELPSALVFPESVAINVDTIRSGDSSNSAFVGEGGQFSTLISIGADVSHNLNTMIDGILENFNDMEIPISTQTTTYDTGGGFYPHVKIDFSDYDSDGDGTKEGCSGHTAATPICFRLWLNGKRFIAGIFSEYADGDNQGAGQFMVSTSGDDDEDPTGDNFLMKIIYDHQDPENKSSELFVLGSSQVMSIGQMQDSGPFTSHFRVTQVGPEESAMKLINMHYSIDTSSFSNITQYIGQWQEGNDFWGGFIRSVIEEESPNELVYENTIACAQISTGNQSDEDNCTDLGIDVTEIDSIDAATEDDVALPDDFPESPTF